MKPKFEYQPPHDHEAESLALACIVDDKRGPLWLNQFDSSDWDDLRNRQIYNAMFELGAMNQRLATWQVYCRLKDTGHIDDKDSNGLKSYVWNLTAHLSSTENFPDYLKRVKDRAWRRQALELLRALALNVCDTSQPVADTKRKLAQAMQEFTK